MFRKSPLHRCYNHSHYCASDRLDVHNVLPFRQNSRLQALRCNRMKNIQCSTHHHPTIHLCDKTWRGSSPNIVLSYLTYTYSKGQSEYTDRQRTGCSSASSYHRRWLPTLL